MSSVKGFKSLIKDNMELVVNSVESVKHTVPINKALKLFNLSRSSFENYKTILIHKCEASYYKWCTRKMPNQLLAGEVRTIKNYMNHGTYKFWSKSSIYLKAIRDNALSCGLSTFYKYCNILGFTSTNMMTKPNNYNPLKTTKPNEVWCTDVTIFKTNDGVKHYIHILMDHFSKMVLGYQIEKHSSGKSIRHLLQSAYLKYKPKQTLFLTDGGSENINSNVNSAIEASNGAIQHKIAQYDVIFSNSMIEAFNKVLKYQFLYPKHINSRTKLEAVLSHAIDTYNLHRPQLNLSGNTPFEVFNKSSIDFSTYSNKFKAQKQYRIAQNRKTSCKVCL